MRRIGVVVSVVLFIAALAACKAEKAQDPRLTVFEKFNHADTYEAARPLVSGLLATQLDGVHARQPDQVPKILNHLHLSDYQPRFVDIDDKTSFLVLEQVKSDTVKQSQQTYLLSREDGKNWTLANRVQGETIVPSLWTKQYAPAEFNQSSQCALSRKNAASSVAEPKWQSALAYRTKDRIEVQLLPFPLTQTDLDYLKMTQGAGPQGAAGAPSSSLQQKHAECRIIFVLGKTNRIETLNIGYDDPALGSSTVFQGPGWATLPPTGAQTSPQTGLPPEFKSVQITTDRIAIDTQGDLPSGDKEVRWTVKLDLPLWKKGL